MQQSQHNGPRESVGLSPEDNFHLRQTEETRILLMNTLSITGTSLKDYELFCKSHTQKLKTEKSELFVEHSFSYKTFFVKKWFETT